MSELAAELAAGLQGAKMDLFSVGSADGRLSTLNSNFARSIRELNDDVQRLYMVSRSGHWWRRGGHLWRRGGRRMGDGTKSRSSIDFLKMVARPGASVAG